jgi:transposase
MMDVLHPNCAGLDVHRDTIVACVRRVEGRAVSYATETFATTTAGLLALSAWLREREVAAVAMEATGVYWRPAWHLLEGDFDLVLANAMHVRNVPGRKTDVNDAHWIADLLARGLIRGSFVPPPPIEELRMLTRTRKQLVRERASHVQRIDKVLQDANVKLGSVVTDILGQSGRAAITALIDGVTDPAVIASRDEHAIEGDARPDRRRVARAMCCRSTVSCCVCTWIRWNTSTRPSPVLIGRSNAVWALLRTRVGDLPAFRASATARLRSCSLKSAPT